MRRRIVVLLMAVGRLVMSAAPALAAPTGPAPPHPSSPRGLVYTGVDRPDQAAYPDVGRQNSQHRNPCSVGLC